MPTDLHIGLLIITIAQIKPVELNNLYTETDILKQYLPQGEWVVVAIQEDNKLPDDEMSQFICMYFKFVIIKQDATCELPTESTIKGVLKIIGGDKLENREFEKLTVVAVSANSPEVFGDTVRHAVCETVLSDASVSDFEIDKLFTIVARTTQETWEEFSVDVGGHVLVVIVVMLDNGTKEYRTVIISRKTHSKATLEKIIDMYHSVYLSQVPELLKPIPIPECIKPNVSVMVSDGHKYKTRKNM